MRWRLGPALFAIGALLASPAEAAPALELGDVHVPDGERGQLTAIVAIARAEVARTPEASRGALPRAVSLSIVRIDRGGGRVGCVVSAAVRDRKSGKLLGSAQGKAAVESGVPTAALERAVITVAMRGALDGAVAIR